MRALPLVLAGLPLLATGQPRLELDLSLDPATRRLTARASLSDERALAGFALDPRAEITRLSIDGRPASPAA